MLFFAVTAAAQQQGQQPQLTSIATLPIEPPTIAPPKTVLIEVMSAGESLVAAGVNFNVPHPPNDIRSAFVKCCASAGNQPPTSG